MRLYGTIRREYHAQVLICQREQKKLELLDKELLEWFKLAEKDLGNGR